MSTTFDSWINLSKSREQMDNINKIQLEKINAAKLAVQSIKSNSIVGLGTGSTAKFAINFLSERIKNDTLNGIYAVASSVESLNQAKLLGIQTLDINSVETIDITIDGADEFDPDLNLIKGGGGALLREKILASISNEVIIITDSQKKVNQLGKFPLPIEVMQIAVNPILKKLEKLHLNPELRKTKTNEPFISDNSNYIIDLKIGNIKNVNSLDLELKSIPGIVENGLFTKYVTKVIMGSFNEVSNWSRNWKFN